MTDDDRASAVLRWCHGACIGLSRAVVPAARQTIISTLIAWTVLNTEPTLNASVITIASLTGPQALDNTEDANIPMLERLLNVARQLQRDLFPDEDIVRSIIGSLSDTLRSASDGPTAAAVLARAISTLPEELRSNAFAALWRAPKDNP